MLRCMKSGFRKVVRVAALAVALVVGVAAPAMAQAPAITLPDLGIETDDFVTAIGAEYAGIVLPIMGLSIAIALVAFAWRKVRSNVR